MQVAMHEAVVNLVARPAGERLAQACGGPADAAPQLRTRPWRPMPPARCPAVQVGQDRCTASLQRITRAMESGQPATDAVQVHGPQPVEQRAAGQPVQQHGLLLPPLDHPAATMASPRQRHFQPTPGKCGKPLGLQAQIAGAA